MGINNAVFIIVKEPEIPVVIPTFPDRKLDPGVNDTWRDVPPVHTKIIANPLEEEVPVWWYHSDHLGSSSYITDILGKPCQYVEYLPFGEIMVEQSTNNVFDNIYKFNGKELDENTGYYYYGARYYDPGMSIFLSVDPLAEHPKQVGTLPYAYVANNPINLIDPTGMIWEDPKQAERLNKSINNRIEKMENSNTKIQAKIDKGGLSNKKLAKLEGQFAENSQKVVLLNQSLTDIEAIGNAAETYTLTRPSASDGTHGVVKSTDGVIKIEGSNTGDFTFTKSAT